MAINTKNIKLTHSTLDNIKTKESPAEKTAFVIRLSAIGSNNDDEIFKIIDEKYRNKVDTFYNRFLLICCFYNFCLSTVTQEVYLIDYQLNN